LENLGTDKEAKKGSRSSPSSRRLVPLLQPYQSPTRPQSSSVAEPFHRSASSISIGAASFKGVISSDSRCHFNVVISSNNNCIVRLIVFSGNLYKSPAPLFDGHGSAAGRFSGMNQLQVAGNNNIIARLFVLSGFLLVEMEP